jgi:HlyD family secretion protein
MPRPVSSAARRSSSRASASARQNLSYTSIYAPIDGIVVERNVDIGQTVTASMSTPQIFLIANDLAQMQILASVDESDIGAIKPDQPVRFTVQAYPDQRFNGTVKQVRLQSKTTENVVNYTVVVSVGNPDGRLLPGMTATLEFLTGSASNVLLAPNAALRFRPTDEMRAEVRQRFQDRAGAAGESRERPEMPADGSGAMAAERAMGSAGARNGTTSGAGGEGRGGAENGAGQRGRRANMPTLWYLDASGKLAIARVRAGLTDGQQTEVEGPGLREGMQDIVGVNTPAQNNGNNALGVFGPPAGAQGGGFNRRPGGF